MTVVASTGNRLTPAKDFSDAFEAAFMGKLLLPAKDFSDTFEAAVDD